jgi:hypothetical protein
MFRMRAYSWTAAAAIAASALAQGPIVVQNLTAMPREEWVGAVVPFRRGAVPGIPELQVKGAPTVWQPFGARWPDGSLRQAICLFRLQMEPLTERVVELASGPAAPLPAGGDAAPSFQFALVCKQGDRLRAAQPQLHSVLESNAARTVVLLSCRIPDTGLVAELTVERCARQPHSYADLAVFFSDPTSEAMECAIDWLALDCSGGEFAARHAERFAIDSQRAGEVQRVFLLRNAVLGDGQGIRRPGVLVPPGRPAPPCPLLATCAWNDSGAFGAFGYVPEPPPWLHGERLRAAFAGRHRQFVQSSRAGGDPLGNGPFGLARNPGQTGDQEDFGVVKLSAVAASGLSSFLYEIEASVLQEALRPVHFYEADGAQVQSRNHPDWIVWSGRTHWHGEVSKDRLGKPSPEPKFQTHGWHGKDREHWSTNTLGAYALLTGAHWARRELQHEIQLYLAGQTTAPGLSTSGSGAPRGVGRTMLAACWLYLATGDEALLARMHERTDQVYWPQWQGRELPPDKVRAYLVNDPDARQLDGNTQFWNPWQDALAAIGFAAFHRLTGSEKALDLADGLALNVLRHGWKHGGGETIVATAIRWNEDGSPPSKEELAAGDKKTVVWSHGTDFSTWCIGAVEWARQAAERKKDAGLVRRAEEILGVLRSRRAAPKDGWVDRLTEWDAVR